MTFLEMARTSLLKFMPDDQQRHRKERIQSIIASKICFGFECIFQTAFSQMAYLNSKSTLTKKEPKSMPAVGG
jgi:hypothetical protein